MVTDQQVQRLRRLDLQGLPKERAADKAGLDAKTARKYRRLGRLPSEVRRMDRDYRTRPDPFAAVWPQLEEQLRLNPGLEAKTLFDDLQRRFPGRFADGQLRTLQRHIKQWRALHGCAQEVFFAQVHQRQVFQADGNRTGAEVLVLGNLNPNVTDGIQRQELLNQLRALQPKLQGLVRRSSLHPSGVAVASRDDERKYSAS